jgi:cytochrome c peroxidase
MRAALLLALGLLTTLGEARAAEQAAPQSVTAATDWIWHLPSYVPPPRVPADNPMSEAKFELGRHLFYDKRLSGNGTQACASCHLQERAFTDGKAVSKGSTGEATPRNSPSIVNSAWNGTYTWANPALVTLERQIENPLYGERPTEMGVTDANKSEILARLRADSKYPTLFRDAFPDVADPISFANIIRAITTFERGVVSFDSRYDRYLQGRIEFTAAEKRGQELFFGERGECHHCHGSSNLNDQFIHAKSRAAPLNFHNTGLYDTDGAGAYPTPNRGIMELSGDPADMGKFRAPSLRNVALTAPYMHDGSVATLEEVVEIYAAGGRRIADGPNVGDGRANPLKSDLIVKIEMSKEEKADLVAFLRTLTDETLISSPRFSDPWAGGVPH